MNRRQFDLVFGIAVGAVCLTFGGICAAASMEKPDAVLLVASVGLNFAGVIGIISAADSGKR